MPSCPEARSAILARYALRDEDRLGRGHEAEVYRLGPDRVLKVFAPHVDPAMSDRRLAFYASLDASAVPFAVPRILELGQEGGTRYAIEARIAGSSLDTALGRLVGGARRGALLAYAEAATRISAIGVPPHSFGEIVAVSPLVADSWAAFAVKRAEADLRANHARLAAAVDRPERALARLDAWLSARPPAEARLVHGDYYPANVMVDEEGRLTGVIDFGPLTLAGDARLDPACALLFLKGLDGIEAEDARIVEDDLRARGLNDADLDLYGLFYAFRFSGTSREQLFRWCARTIQAAC